MVSPPDGNASVASLDVLLKEVNGAFSFPAVAAVVASSQAILAAGTAGVRQIGKGHPVTLQDRFHVGSISKPMAATVLATLVEERLMDWGVMPSEVFIDMRGDIHPLLRDIRLGDLLSHRAGLMPLTEEAEFETMVASLSSQFKTGDVRQQRRAFAHWLLMQPPLQQPREGFLYSNAGYALAGAMAEEVLGTAWETLMQQRLFAPLGLETAGFDWPAVWDREQPWGHRWVGDRFVAHPPDDNYRVGPVLTPAGDVHMSVPDLAQFGQMHLRGLGGEDTLVRAVTVRRLHASLDGYALGWFVDEVGHQHAGSAGTFFAFLLLRPEHDRVYAFATNACDGPTGDETASEVQLASTTLRALVTEFEKG